MGPFGKYPMIIMLHGSEKAVASEPAALEVCTQQRPLRQHITICSTAEGNQTAVGYNTTNGLPTLPVKFPGIVVWPQSSYNGSWEGGWNNGLWPMITAWHPRFWIGSSTL